MKLPNTDNAAFIHAYKHGYRQFIAGSSKEFCPVEFKHNNQLRSYWVKGYEEAQAEYRHLYKRRRSWVPATILILGAMVFAYYLMQPSEYVIQADKHLGVPISEVEEDTSKPSTTAENTTDLAINADADVDAEVVVETVTDTSDENDQNHNLNHDPELAQNTNTTTEATLEESTPAADTITDTISTDELTTAEESSTTGTATDTETTTPVADTDAVLTTDTTNQQAETTPPPVATDEENATDATETTHANATSEPDSTISNPPLTLAEQIQTDHPIVVQATFTTNTQYSKPVDSLTTAPNTLESLVFFTRVKDMNGRHITHIWTYEGKEMARVRLNIKSHLYRTYSRKTLAPGWIGTWQVTVLDDEEKTLLTREIEIVK